MSLSEEMQKGLEKASQDIQTRVIIRPTVSDGQSKLRGSRHRSFRTSTQTGSSPYKNVRVELGLDSFKRKYKPNPPHHLLLKPFSCSFREKTTKCVLLAS
jgi:hypothetical protein